MSIAQSFLPEFDQEMDNTRKILERVPADKFDYKPTPKSMSMGQLAGHVAEMIGWTMPTMEETFFDLGADFQPFVANSPADVMQAFEKNSKAARAAIASASDAAMMQNWRLSLAGNEIFTMPRAAVIRSMILNHVIHHRAQLTVYFRLTGIPVPGLYGPSADEQQPAGA